MAFTLQTWGRSNYTNATDFTVNWAVNPPVLGTNFGAPSMFLYETSVDAQAAIAGAGYFNSIAQDVRVNDLIWTIDNGGVGQFYVVTVVNYGATPLVTVAAFGAAIGIVGNANINNNSINAAKLVNNSITDTQVQAGGLTNASLAANTVTSGVTDKQLIQFATGQLTAAQFRGMFAAPVQLVAAQGANTLIRVHDFSLELQFNAAQYANGGPVGLQYTNTANLAGTAASETIAAAGFTGAAASTVYGALGALPAALAAATTVNQGLFISNSGAAYTVGDSVVNWYVSYSVYTTT